MRRIRPLVISLAVTVAVATAAGAAEPPKPERPPYFTCQDWHHLPEMWRFGYLAGFVDGRVTGVGDLLDLMPKPERRRWDAAWEARYAVPRSLRIEALVLRVAVICEDYIGLNLNLVVVWALAALK